MKTLELIFREVDRATFDRIKSGEKTIETRAGLPEYLEVKAGDELNIVCGAESIKKIVQEVFHFESIEDLLKHFKPDDIMPSGTTREQAIARWHSFPGYLERIEKDGIIAWKLK